MRKELDDALVRDFPELYGDRRGDMRRTAMCWGFSCGDGWEPIIRRLSEELAAMAKDGGVAVKATQVKEKDGGLCFYVAGATDAMLACIAAAARKSEETCEVCGGEGRVREGAWWRTLCARHAHEQGRPIDAVEAKDLGVTDFIDAEKMD